MPELVRRSARFAGRVIGGLRRRRRRLVAAVRRRGQASVTTHARPLVAGLPPRPDQVLVAASAALAETLAPEWHQTVVDVAAPPSDAELAGADLMLIEWSGGAGSAHRAQADVVRVVAARAAGLGTPVLIWDTAVGVQQPPVVELPESVIIGVDDPTRQELYPGRPVLVLGPTFQQREHGPGGTGGRQPLVRVDHREGDTLPSVELLRAAASGSVVLTDRAEAAVAIPGVLSAAGEPEVTWTAKALRMHRELRARQAAVSTRAVLTDWSASARADAVLRAAGRSGRAAVEVSAVVPTMRPEQLDNVLGFIARQVWPRVQLVLVTHGFEIPSAELTERARQHGVEHVVGVPADASITLGACMNLGVGVADGAYVAKMDDDNHYGPHFLHDLLGAFEYADAQVVGKWTHVTYLSATRTVLLRFPGAEHSYRPLVQGGTMLMPRSVATELQFEDLPRRVDTTFLQKVTAAGGRVYSTDRFGFVSVRGADPQVHTWRISDLELLAKPSRLLFYGDPVPYVDV